jgi:hypothetical protein
MSSPVGSGGDAWLFSGLVLGVKEKVESCWLEF